jgi:hypothetical protein
VIVCVACSLYATTLHHAEAQELCAEVLPPEHSLRVKDAAAAKHASRKSFSSVWLDEGFYNSFVIYRYNAGDLLS